MALSAPDDNSLYIVAYPRTIASATGGGFALTVPATARRVFNVTSGTAYTFYLLGKATNCSGVGWDHIGIDVSFTPGGGGGTLVKN